MLKIPGKIPVYIHPFFWVLCAALGWIITNTLSGMVVLGGLVFFSVLFHEYGHALTALAFGHDSTITLFGMGGVTERKGDTKLKTWQECLVIFNGPLAGFLLVCLFYYAYRYLATTGGDPFFVYFFAVGYQINLFWTVLNLFPVHPLDGGKLVSLVLQHFFGIKGLKMAFFFSMIFAACVAILFFLMGNFIAGAIFLMFAFESFRAWKGAKMFSPQDQNDDLRGWMEIAEKAATRGNKDMAIEYYQRVINKSSKGMLHHIATMKLAEYAYQSGDMETAWKYIEQVHAKKDVVTLQLKQRILMGLERYSEALRVGEKLFLEQNSFDVAMQNAYCSAQLVAVTQAVGWILSAKEISNLPIEHLVEHTEFEPIKNTPEFKQLLLG